MVPAIEWLLLPIVTVSPVFVVVVLEAQLSSVLNARPSCLAAYGTLCVVPAHSPSEPEDEDYAPSSHRDGCPGEHSLGGERLDKMYRGLKYGAVDGRMALVGGCFDGS